MQDRPAPMLIFGTWVVDLSKSNAVPTGLDGKPGPGIMIDPEPLGDSSIKTPFDLDAMTAEAREGPINFTNLLGRNGTWCGALVGIQPPTLLSLLADEKDFKDYYLVGLSVAKLNWLHFWLSSRKDREEAEDWRMVNVMLTQRDGQYCKRMAVGQVTIESWEQMSREPDLVWLI